jgi:hypothetical protein
MYVVKIRAAAPSRVSPAQVICRKSLFMPDQLAKASEAPKSHVAAVPFNAC